MKSGEIKTFKADKGFGFIALPGEKDVFFHITQWKAGEGRQPQVGDKVTFKVVDSERGPKAMDVTLASEAAEGEDAEMSEESEDGEYEVADAA